MDAEVLYVSPHAFVTLFMGIYERSFKEAFPHKTMVYEEILADVIQTKRGTICLPGLLIHPEGTPTNG